jgi:hypothetical protein
MEKCCRVSSMVASVFASVTWSWVLCTRVKTHKLVQICKQIVTTLSSRFQDVFALLVPSCCVKSGTSCYRLVTRLMTATDLLQVVPTRLIQAVRNKLLRACWHQLATRLLSSTDLLQVVPTICYRLAIQQFVNKL